MEYNAAAFNDSPPINRAAFDDQADGQQTPIIPSDPRGKPADIPDSRPSAAPKQSPDNVNTSIDSKPCNNLSLLCPDMPPDSIFNKKEFVYHTKKYAHSPQEIRQLLDYWARTGENLMDCCAKYGIEYPNFREIQFNFPEINSYHALAQDRKSHCYIEKGIAIAADSSKDQTEVTRENKKGDILTYTAPNMVAVRRAELHSSVLFRVAGMVNSRYRDKSEITTKNLNLNINSKPVDLANLSANDLS
jgi:hypothetical protein